MNRALVLTSLGAIATFLACDSFEEADSKAPVEPIAPIEGGVDVDTGIDASSDGGPAKRFCEAVSPDAGRVVYCRDFDDGTAAREEWNNLDFTSGQSDITHDGKDVVSPPYSMLARVEANAALCTFATAVRKISEFPAKANVSFDVRIGGLGTRPADGASYFVVGMGACLVILSAYETSGRAHVQLGTGLNEFYPMVGSYPKAGAWAHVSVRIDRAAARFEVFVDRELALDNGAAPLPAECVTDPSPLVVRPGMHCEPVTDAAREVRIDNLLVTASD